MILGWFVFFAYLGLALPAEPVSAPRPQVRENRDWWKARGPGGRRF